MRIGILALLVLSSCGTNDGTCSDGIDIDGDGIVDCQESLACPCSEADADRCANGEDDDLDGLIDCDDDDCALVCIETACDDEVDNDEDGAVDCADEDCFGASGACETEPLDLCHDGLDNDADGSVDCDDDDCFALGCE